MSLLTDLADELGVPPDTLRRHLLSAESEALTPTYVTTDALGRVGAAFSGKIRAEGLVLTAPDLADPADEDRVDWRRPSDDARVGTLSALNLESSTGSSSFEARVEDPADPENTYAWLETIVDQANGLSAIDINTKFNGGGAYVSRITDTLGRSNFIQGVGLARSVLNYGITTFPGFNAVGDESLVSVLHNLPDAPLAVAVVQAPHAHTTAGVRVDCWVNAVSSTGIQIGGRCTVQPIAPTVTVNVYWVAIYHG